MAIQRRQNWLSQERVDVPAVRSVESAVSNDFDTLFKSLVTGTSQGYFLRGFNILMAGAIGGAASGLQMQVDPGALIHIASSQSGTVFLVPPGTPIQQLNAATNTNVVGAFSPSSVNYVSIEYVRFADDTTSAQSYFFDPTSKIETVKNVPQAVTLTYTINITTSTPPANFLTVATVVTDSGNNVVSVEDNRSLLGRLGRGGLNPNPFYTYPWPEGRVEDPGTSSSDSIDPFSGGDKAIGNLKDWMDAVMSSLLEIKGTTYWYSVSSSGSLETLREDLGNTVITGKGSISHGVSPVDKVTPTAPGQINWDQDINIRVIGSSLTYTLVANPTSTDITLTDDEAAYVTLVRGVLVSPNLIFTNGVQQVSSVGAISWTGPLQAGDYLKIASDTDAGYYEILSVDSLTQVTLVNAYAGASTGASGAQGKYAFGTYQTSPTPSTNRDIFISSREDVPAGQDVFWLFVRTDNGGAEPRVYIRMLGTELDEGEDRDVSDTTSAELLKYIGSPHENVYAPQYVAAVSPGALPQITSITNGPGSGISGSQYFVIYSSANARQYTVWFKVSGVGSQPVVPYSNANLEVDVLSTDSASVVASKLAAAFNTTLDFKATPSSAVVSVTNTSPGTCNTATNGNLSSPFAISITQSGTGQGNYVIHDGDSLTLAIKELDEAIGAIEAALDSPTYDEVVEIVMSGATPPTSLNGPVVSGTNITLPNNTREGNIPQKYTVGSGILMVFLNGQFLDLESGAYAEVGSIGAPSDQFQIMIQLEIGDELEIRLCGTGGGGGGGAPGPAGPPGPSGSPGLNGSQSPISISTKTGNYTALSTDSFLRANCATNPVTITLPPAGTVTGQFFYMKKVDPSVNAATLQAFAAELIDGLNSQSTTTQYVTFTVISNGTGWDLA